MKQRSDQAIVCIITYFESSQGALLQKCPGRAVVAEGLGRAAGDWEHVICVTLDTHEEEEKKHDYQ